MKHSRKGSRHFSIIYKKTQKFYGWLTVNSIDKCQPCRNQSWTKGSKFRSKLGQRPCDIHVMGYQEGFQSITQNTNYILTLYLNSALYSGSLAFTRLKSSKKEYLKLLINWKWVILRELVTATIEYMHMHPNTLNYCYTDICILCIICCTPFGYAACLPWVNS